MAADEVLTTLSDDMLETLDGWEVELVLDSGAEVLQPLATVASPFSAAAVSSFATVTPAPAAPAPQNLVQMAVFPTVQETPAACVRLLAASLVGLGSLLFASALFGGR